MAGSAVELGRGIIYRKEDLPGSDTFRFFETNTELKPSTYRQEYRDLTQASAAVQRVVSGIQENFIQKDWKFAAIVGGDSRFAVVFTHPSKIDNSKKCPPLPDFLQPRVGGYSRMMENFWILPVESINKLLKSTDLFAFDLYGAHNALELNEQKRWPVKKLEKTKYYQSGVAFIVMNLQSIQQTINLIEDLMDGAKFSMQLEINAVTNQFQKELATRSAKRLSLLAEKSPNPEKLFEERPSERDLKRSERMGLNLESLDPEIRKAVEKAIKYLKAKGQ